MSNDEGDSYSGLCNSEIDRVHLFHDDNDENEDTDKMSDVCLNKHNDFDSCLTACIDPDLTCEADNNGFIEEINGQLNFRNNIFDSTDTGEHVIQVQQDSHDKGFKKDTTISGHIILILRGSFLTRESL